MVTADTTTPQQKAPRKGLLERYRTTKARVRSALLWRLLREQKKWVRRLIALMLVNFLVNLLVSQQTAAVVDRGIVAQVVSPGDFIFPVVRILLLGVGVALFSRLVMERISYQIEYNLRTSLYNAVQTADLQKLDTVSGGQIVTRALTDLKLVETVLRVIPTAGALLPVIFGMLVFLLIVSPPVALVAAAGLPINLWLLRRFSGRLRTLSWAELNERAEVAAAIDEPVRGIRVVHAFGRHDDERVKVGDRAMRVFKLAMTRTRLLARYDVLLKTGPVIIQALFILVGARLVAGGSLSLGTFVIAYGFVTAITQISQIFDELASVWQYLASAQRRLEDVLQLGSRKQAFGRPLPESSTGLSLVGLGVARGGNTVLDDFDLSVAPGELVVVTGAPSSGKTTVATTAAGLLLPDTGEAQLDGVSMRDLEPGALRKAVRLVGEDPFLFATSIRENLMLGADHALDEEALHRALWAAHAEDVVEGLAAGLDADVGDRGLTLSGGQRQRLAIARAVVEPPRVLILDDALSAVNPSVEVAVIRRLRTHAPNTAILCITRRSGPTAIADRLVRLADPLVRPTSTPFAGAGAGIGAAQRLMAGGGLRDMAAMRASAGLKLADDAPAVSEAEAGIDAPLTWGRVLRPFRFVAFLAFLLVAMVSLARVIPGIFFGSASEYAEEGSINKSDLLALGLVAVGAFGAFANYGYKVVSQRFSQGVMYFLRRRIFHRLSRLGIDYYDRELPGKVAARVVHDLDVMGDFLRDAAFTGMMGPIQFAIGAVILLVIGPDVLPIVLVFSVLMLIATSVQYPLTNKVLSGARDQLGAVTAKFEEDFSARQEIRAFGAQRVQMAKFLKASADLRRARRQVAIVSVSFAESIHLLSQLLLLLVLVRAGELVLAGTMTVGAALAVRAVSQNTTQPLNQLGHLWMQLLNVRVSWSRLQEPFTAPILPVEDPAARDCPELRGEIDFEDVSFSYPHTGRPVLHHVSFNIAAGTTVALVGYTGAGKSSITKLLLRMYDPDEGGVRVDGHDLRELSVMTYRRRVGVVPQDAFAFKGTVASNISYANPGATPEQVEAAARAVGAHDVLSALPDAYEHPVEEEGRNLTAAQRQLIALARAWLAGPDILVLDEATSTLDAALEQCVLDAVARLECTTVMVTHRENVVRKADRVIVIDAGRVVEEGTPLDLIGAGTAFDGLWGGTFEAAAAATPARRRGRSGTRTKATRTAAVGKVASEAGVIADADTGADADAGNGEPATVPAPVAPTRRAR